MIYRGTTMDELTNHLRELDNNRTCEHNKTEDSINVKIHMKKEGIVSWESEVDTDEFLTEYPYVKGERFNQLELFLKKLENQMIDMPFAVLAHYQTKNRLSKDGKVVSRWYLVDPFGKTEENDGNRLKTTFKGMQQKKRYIKLFLSKRIFLFPEKQDEEPNNFALHFMRY